MRMFIFGAGYSGRAIAGAVLASGGWVGGTTRSVAKADELSKQGIEPFLFDTSAVSPEMDAALATTTHLVVSIAPDHGMRSAGTKIAPQPIRGKAIDAVLAAFDGRLAAALAPSLRWIGYLSTVGVYGDHGGGWIDETVECAPASNRSIMRLDAEREWLALGNRTAVPVAVLRLSGIYGPGRNALRNLEQGTARRIIKPGQVFNRIHVDDIAGATMHLANETAAGIFNVSDDEPAPPQDVVAFAAGLMGIEPPPEVSFEDAEMTQIARSFYGESKRVSNAKLKQSGYRFVHPNYRDAITAMWRGGNWRGN